MVKKGTTKVMAVACGASNPPARPMKKGRSNGI